MSKQKTFTVGVIAQLLVFIILVPFLPLLITGRWDWLEAWLYGLIGVLGFIVSRVLASRRHPDLLNERAKMMRHDDAKPWDKVLARLVGLGGGLIPLTAGLDMRGGWSGVDFGWTWKGIALAVMLLGYAIGTWALMENRFFSGVVRIQREREHHVVDSGPYAVVRHPGYVGAILTYYATPILLDSLWTFGVVTFFVVVLIIRTALEDRTLQTELPGYAEFATRTKYRLLPGVW